MSDIVGILYSHLKLCLGEIINNLRKGSVMWKIACIFT